MYCVPALLSAWFITKGPEPMIVSIFCIGSVSASFLRIMKLTGVAGEARPSSRRGNFSFSSMTNVLSSLAEMSFMRGIIS